MSIDSIDVALKVQLALGVDLNVTSFARIRLNELIVTPLVVHTDAMIDPIIEVMVADTVVDAIIVNLMHDLGNVSRD